MSKDMLSDSNTINDFNPYVMGDFSLPGASRKPQEFDRHPLPQQVASDPFAAQPSVMCEYGITAGDKTIDMCRPGTPNCPLSRPFVPGRNIDRGFTVQKFVENVKHNTEVIAERACGISLPVLVLIFLILLVALR
jgi:hypothetical protein